MSRVFIGIGQAFHAPACYALVAMYFPDSRRASANGVYCAGNYLGAAISSLCLTMAGVVGESCSIPLWLEAAEATSLRESCRHVCDASKAMERGLRRVATDGVHLGCLRGGHGGRTVLHCRPPARCALRAARLEAPPFLEAFALSSALDRFWCTHVRR